MKQLLSIPAFVTFALDDETEFHLDEFEKYKHRFEFVDLNFLNMLAVYLRMLSRNHAPGYIHISESKIFCLAVAEELKETHEFTLN
jgi:hypothetical protein